ncbi:Ger(x)C family spore germination protein [Iocasia frigidifontis]|uniref:Ger(X)C family spore germination protein n=1 Tax=Iocasia fonsfrigidae TaxID=2682810 RepID=A0A8A7KCS3_9FIRM|nr:Ger(x)C family spore germination protein [Iocasia fonsfrigidae]QTL99241.1 Ger(x)C family spore germination protein [Iocasia fonsfrigidae]
MIDITSKKKLAILIILPVIFLTGCWSSHEVNTLAINICIGIDKTEKGYFISEQILNPKAIAAEQAINESPVYIYTSEGRDISEVIQRLTKQSARKIYNAHLRMVVFGEDVAKDGIQDILDYFMRSSQYRTDFYFVIAKNATANEVLSILTPIESIPGIKIYDSLISASENWAPTKSVRIIELVNTIIADGINPVLTGIEITPGKTISDSTEVLKESVGIKRLVYYGLGVFKDDRLVGWLDEVGSKGYNYITGNINKTIGHVKYGDNVKITGEVINAKSNVKASLVNGKPVIEVKIKVKQNVEAVEGDFDVSKEENIAIFNKLAEKKIKSHCEKAIKKAKYDFESDIFGFGEVIHRQYPKVWDKIKDNWNNEFVNLPVKVTVNVKINQLGEVTKPFFIKEKG